MAKHRNGEDDETIISSTQAEMAFFLVITFVIVLGFKLAPDAGVGGPGKDASGGTSIDFP